MDTITGRKPRHRRILATLHLLLDLKKLILTRGGAVPWEGVVRGCPALCLSRLHSDSHHLLKHFLLLAPPFDPHPRPRHLPSPNCPRSARQGLGLPPLLCEIAPPLPLQQMLQYKILFVSVILVSEEEKKEPVFPGARVGGYLSNL